MPPPRRPAAGSYLLKLDGKACGFLKSVEGGEATAEVVRIPGPAGDDDPKRLGPTRFRPLMLQLDLSMAQPVYEWIAASWRANPPRKNGSVVMLDRGLEAKSERQFFDAIVTETTIPALDASSRDPAFLAVQLNPARTSFGPASGKAGSAAGRPEQKLWLPSNFRLAIDGLDCSKVAKIDAFVVKQSAADDSVGRDRGEPSTLRVRFPDLRISLSESSAQSWVDWHKSFVIDGNSGRGEQRDGSLLLLAPDLQSQLARIELVGLGIFSLVSDKAEVGADQIRRMTASLYCTRMAIKV